MRLVRELPTLVCGLPTNDIVPSLRRAAAYVTIESLRMIWAEGEAEEWIGQSRSKGF
jgi:hypothetical protein